MLKPGYAPVEQYRSHGKQGPWTDVYAMCATIYRMLTGKVPPASTERAFDDKLEPPSKLGVKISPQQETALLRGLAVNSEERIGSMGELLQCLKGNKKPKARIRWKKLAIPVTVVIAALACMALITTFVRSNRSVAQLVPQDTETPHPQGEWVIEDRFLLVREQLILDEDSNDYDAGTVYSTTDYEYDEYGNVLRENKSGIYNQSYSTEYEYYVDEETGEQRVSSQKHTESEAEASNEYSSFREEYREEEGKIVLCEYDENDTLLGWSVTEENGNETRVYYYYPDGSLRSYSVSVTGGNSRREEEYDPRGQLQYSREETMDGRENVLTSVETWYVSGVPNSTITKSYSYDNQGRIASGSWVIQRGATTEKCFVEAEYEEMTIKVWQPREG